MGRESDVVAGNHLRDAMEGRRAFLQPQTDLWRGVRATSREGIFREVRMKVNCYNILVAMVA